ncbi:hypothetical protein NE236_29730 [Actinoallomurus purpureus]|uniref:hypothetical protein n=1 Tax=Actinoallomurus purpureus TaxID=478114 RepID=UPI002092C360|nr:hypothetical protein [Actinoallomurus purpureus]MCO6009158.1 hypothetical protein [Actinoallomurus purpureus]
MSDEAEDDMRGPVMLAATNMLKPPPAVIGSLNKEITLPRTIKLTTLLSVGIGAVMGFLIALFTVGVGINALIYGPTLGGALGWGAVSFSPLRGESLAKWLGLQANSARQRKLAVDGRPVRLYVGIAPLRRTAAGTVRMLPGGVPVDGVSWDERGFPQQEIPRTTGLPAAPGRQNRRLTASTQLSSQERRKGRKSRN